LSHGKNVVKNNFKMLKTMFWCHNPTFGRVWGWHSHSWKWGFGSPPRLPKLQSSIAGAKTPPLEAFFMSLESDWSVDVENGLAWAIWTSTAQVMEKRRATKSRESTQPRCAEMDCNTPLESSQRDLIPIQGLNKKLWTHKVPGVQIGTVSGLLLGSPKTKSHSDVGAAEQCKEYYMGEGGGFPWIRAVVNLVSPELPVACPNTKGAVECKLTNLLISLMQVRVSN
jgi:hypothetical protein